MTASAPVPDEGELRLGTVRLPAGRPLRLEDDSDEPVAWITETAVPEPGPLWSALTALHGQTGLVLVERPPPDLDAALPVAAEHFVFCDEPAGRQSVRTTAAEIIGAPIWYFWWD